MLIDNIEYYTNILTLAVNNLTIAITDYRRNPDTQDAFSRSADLMLSAISGYVTAIRAELDRGDING